MNPAPDDQRIRHELQKLKKMPPWGRSQGDRWDQLSNFIYRTATLRQVWDQVNAVAIANRLDIEAFGAYAVRRWYNHHTHDQLLRMFCAQPGVRAEANRKHHAIDFYLRELPFDLKLSRFPRAYSASLDQAQRQPHQLALWLYQNQSKQGRYHTTNRLFIIFHHQARPALTWQLRRDFDRLETLIKTFVASPTLLGLTVTNHHTGQAFQPWSAILFHVT